ncbi:hypothetical protein HK405_007624, partial [Cladochytrium tenue]
TDPSRNRSESLSTAVSSRNVELVNILLSTAIDPWSDHSLSTAAQLGDEEIVSILMSREGWHDRGINWVEKAINAAHVGGFDGITTMLKTAIEVHVAHMLSSGDRSFAQNPEIYKSFSRSLLIVDDSVEYEAFLRAVHKDTILGDEVFSKMLVDAASLGSTKVMQLLLSSDPVRYAVPDASALEAAVRFQRPESIVVLLGVKDSPSKLDPRRVIQPHVIIGLFKPERLDFLDAVLVALGFRIDLAGLQPDLKMLVNRAKKEASLREKVETLLYRLAENGVQADRSVLLPLAAELGDLPLVLHIIEKSPQLKDTTLGESDISLSPIALALVISAASGAEDVLQVLLLFIREPPPGPATAQQEDTRRVSISRAEGTALVVAAKSGNLSVVQTLTTLDPLDSSDRARQLRALWTKKARKATVEASHPDVASYLADVASHLRGNV